MIQSYDLGDGKPAYLLEDMRVIVENLFFIHGIRVRVPYPRDDREATLLGIMFDYAIKNYGNYTFSVYR